MLATSYVKKAYKSITKTDIKHDFSDNQTHDNLKALFI